MHFEDLHVIYLPDTCNLQEGWQEGIGTSITPGSLVRFDVWAVSKLFLPDTWENKYLY